jgi:hypothetical protein
MRVDRRIGFEGPHLVGTDNVIEQFPQLRVFQDLSDHFDFAVGESGNRLDPTFDRSEARCGIGKRGQALLPFHEYGA